MLSLSVRFQQGNLCHTEVFGSEAELAAGCWFAVRIGKRVDGLVKHRGNCREPLAAIEQHHGKGGDTFTAAGEPEVLGGGCLDVDL
jgi:hypothetical protein